MTVVSGCTTRLLQRTRRKWQPAPEVVRARNRMIKRLVWLDTEGQLQRLGRSLLGEWGEGLQKQWAGLQRRSPLVQWHGRRELFESAPDHTPFLPCQQHLSLSLLLCARSNPAGQVIHNWGLRPPPTEGIGTGIQQLLGSGGLPYLGPQPLEPLPRLYLRHSTGREILRSVQPAAHSAGWLRQPAAQSSVGLLPRLKVRATLATRMLCLCHAYAHAYAYAHAHAHAHAQVRASLSTKDKCTELSVVHGRGGAATATILAPPSLRLGIPTVVVPLPWICSKLVDKCAEVRCLFTRQALH